MPIANYTTEVPAIKSVGEIQGILVGHGAKAIMLDYDDDVPTGLAFIIKTDHGELQFRLPANVKQVEKILLNMRARPLETWHSDYKRVMERVRKQSARVAWRIIKDWVRAQMAILETEMVKIEQIFLPYMVTKGNQTLFEAMEDKGFYLTEGK
ncbi:hypothetical protein LCGC14_0654780 [marine sediment metagenome]|uniref:Uncharacterized protein n=1 Tax=marine sediment metagenome TaxID=412755 RepID=A0A0F9TGX9_9ZZZZ